MTVSRHHNVLPFSAATATQQDQRTVARKCPKHDFQREIFFCTACDVTICPHCKLTSHDGHVTEDLSDAATKARQELQRMLGEIQQRVRLLEMREAGTKKALVRLQEEFNSADDVIKKRRDDVIRWAEQAGAEALDAARELCHVIEDSLNQRLEATQHVMSGLTARTKHITTVLSGEDNAEVMKLLADITAADGSGGNETTGVGEDTEGGGDCKSRSGQETGSSQFLLVQHDDTGNAHSAIMSYIGRVSGAKPSSDVPASVVKSAPNAAQVHARSTQRSQEDAGALQSQQGRAAGEQPRGSQGTGNNGATPSEPGTSSTAAASSVPSVLHGAVPGIDLQSVSQRQPLPDKTTASIRFSSNPQTVVVAMFLTADNKLWVKYRPPNSGDVLKLFDADGTQLGFWKSDPIPAGRILVCVGDTLLSPRDWRWFKPSGESGCLGNAPNDWALCSKSLPTHVVLRDDACKQNVASKTYRVYRLQVRCLQPLEVALVAVCEKGVTFMERPTDFDVSSCGTVFCFKEGWSVHVYCFAGQSTGSPKDLVQLSHCYLPSLNIKTDGDMSVRSFVGVSFVRLGGKDLVVVLANGAYFGVRQGGKDRMVMLAFSDFPERIPVNVLLVLDHEDGFLLKCSVEGNKECTQLTAHNTGGRVWLGDVGGEIRVLDLTQRRLL